MIKGNKLSLGLLALAVLLTLTAASCRRGNNNQTTTPPVTETPTDQTGDLGDLNLPPTGSGSSGDATNLPLGGLPDADATRARMQQELTEATSFIKSLKDDVVLQLVSMKFVNSLSDQGGLATNYYIFSSPSDPQYYYLVNVPHNGERSKRFLMPRADLDLPFDLIPVQTQYWKLSYVDAMKLAEANGGTAFRAKHSKFEVSAILAQPAGQFLNWFVTYRATDGTGELLQVSVDSYSGGAKVIQ